jgi:hypothetical protein
MRDEEEQRRGGKRGAARLVQLSVLKAVSH